MARASANAFNRMGKSAVYYVGKFARAVSRSGQRAQPVRRKINLFPPRPPPQGLVDRLLRMGHTLRWGCLYATKKNIRFFADVLHFTVTGGGPSRYGPFANPQKVKAVVKKALDDMLEQVLAQSAANPGPAQAALVPQHPPAVNPGPVQGNPASAAQVAQIVALICQVPQDQDDGLEATEDEDEADYAFAAVDSDF